MHVDNNVCIVGVCEVSTLRPDLRTELINLLFLVVLVLSTCTIKFTVGGKMQPIRI